MFILIQNSVNLLILKPTEASFIYCLFMAQINGLHFYIIANYFGEMKQKEFVDEAFEMLWKMIED